MELPTAYAPQEHEREIYKRWEASGFFNPDNLPPLSDGSPRTKRFSMVLPPPNVTGTAHVGHALTATIQDIMTRYHRMRGEKTLWLPGTDHAAIATQSKVEKEIYKKEGKTRYDLGREELLGRVGQFAKDSHDTIVSQHKQLGASLDWSREAFTLDEDRSRAVREAFKRMYDAGLIYRGNRIVNWDPKLQTTVSDDEIEWKEETAPYYYLQYGPFVISTARPETKFGDKYVVMHPNDERYKKYRDGQKIELEWINGPITATVIKDEAVDPEFGTGVMTITPWHDAADFDIAERHDLDKEQIIDENGKLLPIAGEFSGQHITKVRALIVEKLRARNLVVRSDETYVHRVATNSRGGGIIEPQIKEQWFVGVNRPFVLSNSNIKGIPSGSTTTLKELIRAVVANGQTQIIPDRFEKIYFHWIDNLRDWCISRQIWYGHRIPAWYDVTDEKNRSGGMILRKDSLVLSSEARDKIHKTCEGHGPSGFTKSDGGISVFMMQFNVATVVVEKLKLLTWGELKAKISQLQLDGCENPTISSSDPKKPSLVQDPDTLDTWFSSGLWTFSTLGWPNRTGDLNTYHPTDVLETGYDILFFWIARMILMSGFLLGDVPFKTVYLHGLVRDEYRRKMSKSLGNIINPIEITNTYGTDALRMALIIGTGPGNDSVLSENKVKAHKHFANKIWNASRFVLMRTEDVDWNAPAVLTDEDKNALAELNAITKDVTTDIEEFRFYLAGEKLYHYFWHTYADKIIEAAKPRLMGSDATDKSSFAKATEDKRAAAEVTMTILATSLKLLHPFMPFITEHVWSLLPAKKRDADLLMVASWPK